MMWFSLAHLRHEFTIKVPSDELHISVLCLKRGKPRHHPAYELQPFRYHCCTVSATRPRVPSSRKPQLKADQQQTCAPVEQHCFRPTPNTNLKQMDLLASVTFETKRKEQLWFPFLCTDFFFLANCELEC